MEVSLKKKWRSFFGTVTTSCILDYGFIKVNYRFVARAKLHLEIC